MTLDTIKTNNGKIVSLSLSNIRQYSVLIDRHVVEHIGSCLTSTISGRRIAILSNSDVLPLYGPPLEQSLKDNGFEPVIIEIPVGEANKNLSTISNVLDKLLALKFERHDAILALGGGVIGDMAGFVASIYLRGIHFIQVPTTLLAQVDAAIGGKTGVNHSLGKNMIGCFYQPRAVLCDLAFLHTLPEREVLCGLAEIVKYGVIRNPELFHLLESNSKVLSTCRVTDNEDLWLDIIYRSVKDKCDVVSQDEREAGIRETLNFGHTVGHAIEAATEYTCYLHGEAIAIGMVAASLISVRMGCWSSEHHTRLYRLLNDLGFDLTIRNCTQKALIDCLSRDKKVRNGIIRFVLPTDIGNALTRDDVSIDMVHEVVNELMETKE